MGKNIFHSWDDIQILYDTLNCCFKFLETTVEPCLPGINGPEVIF